MKEKQNIFDLIKKSVAAVDPGATVILYGSYARGDYRETSDIDLLILLDINREKLTYSEKFKITSPIYDIGLETDTLISPKIYSKIGWARHRVTPYYENVNKEGIIL